MSTTLHGPDSELAHSTRILIAVIGPDDARRRVVTKALSNSEDRTVQEFAAYPAKLSDLPRMMEQNYDLVMVDLDSNQEYALEIVEFLAAIAKATVMVYSTRNDPSLLEAAIKVGARDLLPIPADAVGAAGRSSAATNGAGPARAASDQQFRDEMRPAVRQDAAETSPAKRPDGSENGTYKGGAFYPKTDPQSMVRRTEPAESATEFKQWDASPVRAAQPAGVKAPEANSRPAIAPPSAPRPGIPAVPPAPRAATAAAPAARSIAPAPLARGESRQTAVDSAPAAPARAHGGIETDADVLALFRNKAQADEELKPEVDWKKWGLIAAGAAALVVVVLIVFMRPSGKSSAAAPATYPVASQPETSTAGPVATTATTAGSTPSITKPSASVPVVAASDATASADAPVRTNRGTAMMDAQLSAPSRISKDVKRTAADDAPGSLAPVAIDEGSSVPGSVFGGGSKVKVVSPVTAISAGVAEGMLIHRTEPVYPKFAKDNHIAGTVVLKAKIGKNGTLEDLRVVSGPKLLGSAALDAVKSWRYRPYMLNNQPVEVDTAISVVFSLGKQ